MVEPIANEKDQHPQEALRNKYVQACDDYMTLKRHLMVLRTAAFPRGAAVLLELPGHAKEGVVTENSTCPPDLIPVMHLETKFEHFYPVNCVQLDLSNTPRFPPGALVTATRGSSRNVTGTVCHVPECPEGMIAVRLSSAGKVRWYKPKQLTLVR